MLIAFLLLSVADLLLTLKLCEMGVAFESNPLAAYALWRWGWMGLAAYKVFWVSMVATVIAWVRRSRPRTAMFLEALACCVTLAVVVFSGVVLTLAAIP